MWGGNFAPVGWNFCDGTTLQISQFDALYQLIGTTYGGDGVNTFDLPNLSGRVPVHQGGGFVPGQVAGTEAVTLTTNQLPVHSHSFLCSTNPGGSTNPPGNVPATIVGANSAYAQVSATVGMNPGSIGADPGGGQPHDNLQPYLCVTFIIALYGIFPSQS